LVAQQSLPNRPIWSRRSPATRSTPTDMRQRLSELSTYPDYVTCVACAADQVVGLTSALSDGAEL